MPLAIKGFPESVTGCRRQASNISGFTLVELLISMAILGIIIGGLYQTLGRAVSTYEGLEDRQELLARARFATERLLLFVRETDRIVKPDDVNQGILQVSERVLDTYHNTTRAYIPDGDGRPDADNDADGLVNEDGDIPTAPDPREYISFQLDGTALKETRPDYATAAKADLAPAFVLCQDVAAFRVSRLSLGGPVVELELTLDNGRNRVSVKTRGRARLIE